MCPSSICVDLRQPGIILEISILKLKLCVHPLSVWIGNNIQIILHIQLDCIIKLLKSFMSLDLVLLTSLAMDRANSAKHSPFLRHPHELTSWFLIISFQWRGECPAWLQ